MNDSILGWLYFIFNKIKVVFSIVSLICHLELFTFYFSDSLIGVMHGSDDTHSVQTT